MKYTLKENEKNLVEIVLCPALWAFCPGDIMWVSRMYKAV